MLDGPKASLYLLKQVPFVISATCFRSIISSQCIHVNDRIPQTTGPMLQTPCRRYYYKLTRLQCWNIHKNDCKTGLAEHLNFCTKSHLITKNV